MNQIRLQEPALNKKILWIALLVPSLALAQEGSSSRKQDAESSRKQQADSSRKKYEGEKNGPFGECETEWKRLRGGLHYRVITCLGKEQKPERDLHVVRVDPEQWTVNVYLSQDASAREVVNDKNAVFAINANFFDTERRPLGLVVRNNEQVRGLRPTSWQAIFLMREDGSAEIIRVDDWKKYRDDAFMAVQAGPRLLVDGERTAVKNTYAAARSGVCLRDDDIIFFATPSDRKFHLTEIARIAQRKEEDGGLACDDAMLFDGGHSTQLYLKTGDKPVSIKGDPAPVFVYVREREEKKDSRGDSTAARRAN